jgi:hypothetical protein
MHAAVRLNMVGKHHEPSLTVTVGREIRTASVVSNRIRKNNVK